jgi:hypothetical protein
MFPDTERKIKDFEQPRGMKQTFKARSHCIAMFRRNVKATDFQNINWNVLNH